MRQLITDNVNAVALANGSNWTRSVKDVQKKYKNQKMKIEEKIASERKSTNKTGGGPPDVSIMEEDEFASSLRGNEAFEGIKGGKESTVVKLSGACSSPYGTDTIIKKKSKKLAAKRLFFKWIKIAKR